MAGAFPLPANSHLRVVSAVSIPPSALDVPTVRDFEASLREAARQTAEAARAALAHRFADDDVQVLEGDAREAILRVAEEWPADLVVLGARGLGAVAGFLLGSVSLGVARHARCSVLVVKGAAEAIRGALVAIDGSAHAAAAAAFLARLPLDPTAVVRLVGVVQPPRYPATTPRFASGMVREAIAQIVKERSTALEQALAKAASPFAWRREKRRAAGARRPSRRCSDRRRRDTGRRPGRASAPAVSGRWSACCLAASPKASCDTSTGPSSS